MTPDNKAPLKARLEQKPEGIEWLVKKAHNQNKSISYIVIKSCIDKNKRESTNISIPSYLAKKISRSEYIKVGVYQDKLYFAESNKQEGYKITYNSNCKIGSIKISSSILPISKNKVEEGQYPLKSNRYGFYISLRDKIKGAK